MAAIALICPRVRIEEKAIRNALEVRGARCMPIAPGAMELEWGLHPLREFDGALLSGVEPSQAALLSQWLEAIGLPTVNPSRTSVRLADRVALHLALRAADVLTPPVSIAFSSEIAVQCIETIGYPVISPPIHPGAGDRLTPRLNDRAAATAVIEHRKRFGGFRHHVTYVQPSLSGTDKRHRHLVIGNECVAIESGDLRDPDARKAAVSAAHAVGGGILFVEIETTEDGRTWVNEVMSASRFRDVGPVERIAGRIADHVLREVANGGVPER